MVLHQQNKIYIKCAWNMHEMLNKKIYRLLKIANLKCPIFACVGFVGLFKIK